MAYLLNPSGVTRTWYINLCLSYILILCGEELQSQEVAHHPVSESLIMFCNLKYFEFQLINEPYLV